MFLEKYLIELWEVLGTKQGGKYLNISLHSKKQMRKEINNLKLLDKQELRVNLPIARNGKKILHLYWLKFLVVVLLLVFILGTDSNVVLCKKYSD